MERLRDCRLLLVEDEMIIADELAALLRGPGAIVLGPATSVESALSIIDLAEEIDGAFLDIKLGGELAFAVADALEARNVPFAFLTGYDRSVVPERHERAPLFEKPLNVDDLVRMAIFMCCAQASARMNAQAT